MERVAGDVEALHLGVADLDALLVGPRVERALDLQAGFRRGRADELDDSDTIVSGRPRQFCVMWQNRRRSICSTSTCPADSGIPYGVLDITANLGWVSLGITHDTAEFAVHSIRTWVDRVGRARYPIMRELMITADCGGSNGARVRLWKLELQQLADQIRLPINASLSARTLRGAVQFNPNYGEDWGTFSKARQKRLPRALPMVRSPSMASRSVGRSWPASAPGSSASRGDASLHPSRGGQHVPIEGVVVGRLAAVVDAAELGGDAKRAGRWPGRSARRYRRGRGWRRRDGPPHVRPRWRSRHPRRRAAAASRSRCRARRAPPGSAAPCRDSGDPSARAPSTSRGPARHRGPCAPPGPAGRGRARSRLAEGRREVAADLDVAVHGDTVVEVGEPARRQDKSVGGQRRHHVAPHLRVPGFTHAAISRSPGRLSATPP